MNILLLVTIGRVIWYLLIACGALVIMVIYVQHNPGASDGMKYIWFYCCPVLAAFTALVSIMAIRDYLHPELEDEQELEESEE